MLKCRNTNDVFMDMIEIIIPAMAKILIQEEPISVKELGILNF